MKQKTVDLIKGWAIVIGVLSLSSLLTLSVYPLASTIGLLSIIAIGLGLAVLYVGVQVTSLSFETVNIIFWLKFIFLIINFLYSISGRNVSGIRLLIILAQGAIMWFLIMSLKKLSKSPSTQTHP